MRKRQRKFAGDWCVAESKDSQTFSDDSRNFLCSSETGVAAQPSRSSSDQSYMHQNTFHTNDSSIEMKVSIKHSTLMTLCVHCPFRISFNVIISRSGRVNQLFEWRFVDPIAVKMYGSLKRFIQLGIVWELTHILLGATARPTHTRNLIYSHLWKANKLKTY